MQNTESNLESEEDDALIVGHVVLLGQDALQLVLGHGGALGVDNLNRLRAKEANAQITIWRRLRRGFLMNFLTRTVTAASDMVIQCSSSDTHVESGP